MQSVLYTTDSENGKDSCLKERRVEQNSTGHSRFCIGGPQR